MYFLVEESEAEVRSCEAVRRSGEFHGDGGGRFRRRRRDLRRGFGRGIGEAVSHFLCRMKGIVESKGWSEQQASDWSEKRR